jgi:hypothetical protein
MTLRTIPVYRTPPPNSQKLKGFIGPSAAPANSVIVLRGRPGDVESDTSDKDDEDHDDEDQDGDDYNRGEDGWSTQHA